MADRIEREIEEILSRIDRMPPRRRWSLRLRQTMRRFRQGLAGLPAALPRPHISLGQLMLLGGVLIIVGYVFGVGSSEVNRWLIIVGLILLLLAFLLSWRRSSRAHIPERRWRGQPLELDQGVGDRQRSWWQRWRSRR